MTTAERLTELMVKISEVSIDVKHLLTRQDETGERIDRMEDRNDKHLSAFEDRLRVVETMRGKLLGIAFVAPIVISVGIFLIGRTYG